MGQGIDISIVVAPRRMVRTNGLNIVVTPISRGRFHVRINDIDPNVPKQLKKLTKTGKSATN